MRIGVSVDKDDMVFGLVKIGFRLVSSILLQGRQGQIIVPNENDLVKI